MEGEGKGRMVNVNTQVALGVRLPFGEYTGRFGCADRFGRREIRCDACL